MAGSLRVLLVEDSENDAELMAEALQSAGYDLRLRRVESEDELRHALGRGPWDIVFADYHLPRFDGLAALRIVKGTAPELPVVLVSGTIGEELAVAAMREGAHDYVLKQNLHRLGPVVEREMAEVARRQRHREAETALLEASPDAMIVVAPDGRILRASRRADGMFGTMALELIGVPFRTLLPSLDSRRLLERLPIDGPGALDVPRELTGRRRDGSEFPVELVLTPLTLRDGVGFIAALRDLTDRRRTLEELARRAEELANANTVLQDERVQREKAEAELRLAQKLESVGQLAAGVAHEINTPTQYVSDNVRFVADAVRDLLPPLKLLSDGGGAPGAERIRAVAAALRGIDLPYLVEEMPKALEQALEGLDRVARIVRAMKDFSHPGEQKAPANLHAAIENTIVVARHEWKYVADVETDFDPGLGLVPCHAADFKQVVLNVLVNAAHAIESVRGQDPSGKGRIRIATRRADPWAEIRISDDGCGIPEQHQSRVFEPFFTTKEVGKGTGQGLAIAYSVIVKKHGGTMHVESEVGRGTTFVMRIPLADPCPDGVGPDAAGPDAAGADAAAAQAG